FPLFPPVFPHPGVVPQSAPPVPTASSRFHFPPLEPHSPCDDSQPRFPPAPLLPPRDTERKTDPPELEENPSDWRRDLLAPSQPSGSAAPPKRKTDVVLPLFSRPAFFPEPPGSPFSLSPLPGRPGVLNVPLSPALSLTPTLFSYSPSPGLSPFAGSSCFSFNPEEMKHYLHSQACSVFNYHLSPRTFPRYPLVVPPLQAPGVSDEQPFAIKLQPPPAGRRNRDRTGSPEATAPRVKLEPPAAHEEKAEKPQRREEDEEEEEGEEEKAVFARPAAPAWESAEKSGDAGGAERREDALMPPKLRLKRRWNGAESAEDPRQNG
ncbi:ETV3 protein, partial [Spelaeornis formosus]|nr:ETV3 protein [Elachura formosa]